MRIDLFSTLDEGGEQLTRVLRDAIRGAKPAADVRVISSRDPLALEQSVLVADVVVLDLTPAADGVHRYTTMRYPVAASTE
jgi:hypothetical protein